MQTPLNKSFKIAFLTVIYLPLNGSLPIQPLLHQRVQHGCPVFVKDCPFYCSEDVLERQP